MKAFLISPFKVARELNLRRVEHASASLSKGLEKIKSTSPADFRFQRIQYAASARLLKQNNSIL